MKLIEKGVDGHVHLPWDAAQAALASGAYEPHKIEGERGPDMTATQSPAPGTDPLGGTEQKVDGNAPSNISPTIQIGEAARLPKEPAAPAETVQQPAKAVAATKIDDKKA